MKILYNKHNGTQWIYSENEKEGWTNVKPPEELYIPKFRNNKWVEGATPEQIKFYRRQKEYEQDLEFALRKKQDGAQYYEEIDARLVSLMKGKTDDERNALDVEYRRKILPYIELVQSGQWWTARRMMNNTTLPKLDEIRSLFLEVRQRINDYVTENYPQ